MWEITPKPDSATGRVKKEILFYNTRNVVETSILGKRVYLTSMAEMKSLLVAFSSPQAFVQVLCLK